MIFDLAIIGGGINGCGIARDAAGRGLNVVLVEQDDLASATSSWSSKLIHGGLRYLEQFEFRLVREALQEREVLLKIAPHIIHPLAFVLPHDSHMRPAWMIRMGLFLYDHIGGKISLPGSHGLSFPDDRFSAGLRPSIRRGFFYSDARVDDARLTVLNAMSAKEHGADIRTRTKLISGQRKRDHWQLVVRDVDRKGTNNDTNDETVIQARAVVNAAGPWVKHVLNDELNIATPATVRLVKGSHIVVPRIYPGTDKDDHAYILQNDDGRVIFIIPYEGKYSLIGTTDITVNSVDEGHNVSDAEVKYLLHAASRYLSKALHERDIVWRYAGVRPLYDDGEANPSAITRDYVLKVDHINGNLPLLSIFGGKITTYRRLAEHALTELAPYVHLPHEAWTATAPLPGGDFDEGETAELYALLLQPKHPGVPPDLIRRIAMRHGTRTSGVLNGARSIADLGEFFGAGLNLLCEREIDYLIREEWAKTPDDILWRRTKCGLHMDDDERERAAAFIWKKLSSINPVIPT